MMVWKPVPDWPYEVSDEGNVRRVGSEKPLTPMWVGRKRKKYAAVRLSKNDTTKTFKVHRLVCELFNGPALPGQLACHRDDDTRNNRAGNLYWGTASDNVQDRVRARPMAAFAQEIRNRRAAGEKGSALAREFGVSPQLICDIAKGRCYPPG